MIANIPNSGVHKEMKMPDHAAVAPEINVKAALFAAFIAGATFIMLGILVMVVAPVFAGDSSWSPAHLLAAIGMDKGALPLPANLDAVAITVTTAIYAGLSLILAFLFALIVRGRTFGMVIFLGIVFGLFVYLIGFYSVAPMLPVLDMARGWDVLFIHLAYGTILGWVYGSVARKKNHLL